MTDLIERLRDFEGSDELGNGDFSLLSEAAAEIKTLRAEVDRWKVPLLEWLDKTEWVQQTVKPHELGHHRADVLRHRIEQTEAENERLRAEVKRLTGCLTTANANHEQFERQWYLERDRAARLAEALRNIHRAAHDGCSAMDCAREAHDALAQEDRNG